MPAERFVISGRVQGVGYRWWTIETAAALRLRGWVRNRRDGTVEALAIGEQAALDRLAVLCAEGPAAAIVEAVAREPAADDGSTRFMQRPTV
jgi:acylphosphatase